MINGKDNPVEWALMGYELDEVIEHLQNISNQFKPQSEVCEIEFGVDMGHVYAHLNRIWNSRNHKGDILQEQFDKYSEFPDDVELIG